jgi:uncharacterized protein with PIN domain
MPLYWLKSPTSENVKIFIKKITIYEKEAKCVRKLLLNDWMDDVKSECKKCIGPVQKLSYLRASRENVWPCGLCSMLGKILLKLRKFNG